MPTLTLERAKQILHKHVTEEHLRTHALAVSAAMGAMATFFGADKNHWMAIGYLHDVDYQKFPDEHLAHVEELLAGEDISGEDIRAILSHGYGLCSAVEPLTELEKSLFTVDELTGIVHACALMRPTGISDMEVSSLKKKFKDKRFAAGCSREVILQGCDMLAMDISDVMRLTIEGMREFMTELGIGVKEPQ